jgi:hypothetical protein
LASLSSRSAGVTFAPASRYRARVRVKDASGVWSPWAYSTVVGSTRYQETSEISRTGTWTRTPSIGASGAYVRFASRALATATFSFVGRAVTWIAPRGPGRGAARIYVDNVYRTTVNLSRSATLARSIAFAASWSSSSRHTIAIHVVGTPGHPRVDIDAFAVLR